MKLLALTVSLLLTNSAFADVLDKRVPIPQAPATGVQVLMPEVTIEPHGEKQVCYYTTLNNENEEAIIGFQSYQDMESGHHLLGFLTTISPDEKPDGTIEDCTMGTPLKSEFLLFPLNDSWKFKTPAGYALALPKKARIIFQFHYHNHNRSPILVRDVMNIDFANNPQDLKYMASFLTATLDFKVPPHEKYSVTYECPILAEIDFYSLGGHIHEQGTRSKIEMVRDGNVTELYNVAWKPEDTMLPPVVIYEQSPLKLTKGDALRVTCEWENKTDKELSYPAEMCGSVGYHVSGPAPVACAVVGGKPYYRGSVDGKRVTK
jgi:hypothetical protein